MPGQEERLDFYNCVSRQASLPEQALEELYGIATRKTYKKGSLLLKEGQVCKRLFLVQEGALRTFISKEGKEINTGFAFEGDFVTELRSLRHAEPARSNISALESSTVYEFEKARLFELYDVSPAISSFGRRVLEQVLMAQEEYAALFKAGSPAERYAYIARSRPHLLQRLSLSQLASYLGIARETLSRIRKQQHLSDK